MMSYITNISFLCKRVIMTSNRVPMSVLAVRPKTKSPPRVVGSELIIEDKFRSSPTIKEEKVLFSSPSRGRVTLPPRRPASSSEILSLPKIPSNEEGMLLPYVPDHYEITSNNKVKVVVPSVSPSQLPSVIPTARPRSPPRMRPETQLGGLRPRYTPLPVEQAGSYPAILTGENPPLNKGASITLPTLSIFKSSEGTIAYTRPIDITSYPLSQDETPLPLSISEQPVITSAVKIPSLPPQPSIPYRLDDVLSPSPSSPSLRHDPLLLSSRIPRSSSPRYIRPSAA